MRGPVGCAFVAGPRAPATPIGPSRRSVGHSSFADRPTDRPPRPRPLGRPRPPRPPAHFNIGAFIRCGVFGVRAMSSSDTKHCASCGKEAARACTQCRKVAYCGVGCQKAAWKEHKKVCFPDGAECTRCLEIIDASNLHQCQVPHPEHMLQDAGSTFGGGGRGNSWNFVCEACEQSFTRQSPDYDGKDTAPITKGAKFCYRGPHTIKPLKKTDERRVRDDVLNLTVGSNLQEEIDAIPSTMPNVRVLTIQSTGCYDDSFNPKLEVSMPQLETLKLIDVAFGKVKLTKELTPNVEELYLQNIPDDCNLTILLPDLKSFSMHYYGRTDDDAWIRDMLSTSTKLQSFDSYKLRVGPALNFASNDLEYVRLHRAELLESLTIYAPKLRELNLQGCYGLIDGDLAIMESHPDFTRPAGRPSAFIVNTTNACISQSIVRTLQNNPRVMWDEDEDGDRSGVTNPCEGILAQVQRMMPADGGEPDFAQMLQSINNRQFNSY